jgi:DNA-binding response OmpR family regulator
MVESDFALGDRVFQALRQDAYGLEWVSSPSEAEAILREQRVALLIVDLTREATVEGRRGLMCRLRRIDHSIPAIAVTDHPDAAKSLLDCADAVEDITDSISGLMAAVARLVPPTAGYNGTLIKLGELAVDAEFRIVRRGSETIALSRKEYAVLRCLVLSPGEAVSRQELLDGAYHWSEEIGSNALEVHISKLRKKLGSGAIETVRGVGYRFAVEP